MPLTYRALKAQKELQEIQPRIQEIRLQFKDDQEKMATELMNVYKNHNVNPFAACLPTLVQLFVFIALYQALRAGMGEVDPGALYPFIGNPGHMSSMFLWLDLSQVSVFLAFLAGVTQYFQARQMVTTRPPKVARSEGALDEDMTASMNKMMVTVLPLMMFAIGATTLPGGLTLYIVVSTALTWAMYAYFARAPKIVHKEGE
jgi:YidC/Oxa1 family membrane protein insertase